MTSTRAERFRTHGGALVWLSNMRSMIAVEPTFSAGRTAARPPLIELVSATDGRTHRVTEWSYSSALASGAGHCVAVCAHDVVLCAMTTPPTRPCRRCTDLL